MMQKQSKSFKKFVDDRYIERSLANHLGGVPLFSECDADFVDRLKKKVQLVSFEKRDCERARERRPDRRLAGARNTHDDVRAGAHSVAQSYPASAFRATLTATPSRNSRRCNWQ